MEDNVQEMLKYTEDSASCMSVLWIHSEYNQSLIEKHVPVAATHDISSRILCKPQHVY